MGVSHWLPHFSKSLGSLILSTTSSSIHTLLLSLSPHVVYILFLLSHIVKVAHKKEFKCHGNAALLSPETVNKNENRSKSLLTIMATSCEVSSIWMRQGCFMGK